jgi:hypothetical protein
MRRVMAAGAPARFVLHHASSIVADTARESLSQARELEEQAQAFVDLREYVAAERTDSARAARLMERMSERMRSMRDLAAHSKRSRLLADVLPALGDLFELRTRLSPGDFAAAFDRTYGAFKAAEQTAARPAPRRARRVGDGAPRPEGARLRIPRRAHGAAVAGGRNPHRLAARHVDAGGGRSLRRTRRRRMIEPTSPFMSYRAGDPLGSIV